MRFVACECGAKIGVVTDLQQVKRSIDRHAAKHARAEAGRQKAKKEQSRIETQLAQKVIMLIIGMDTGKCQVAQRIEEIA